jgi:hypothetical protein
VPVAWARDPDDLYVRNQLRHVLRHGDISEGFQNYGFGLENVRLQGIGRSFETPHAPGCASGIVSGLTDDAYAVRESHRPPRESGRLSRAACLYARPPLGA